MVKICVLQTDNRPTLDYLLKTQEVNKMFCNYLNYDYSFIEFDNNEYQNIHPCNKKIHIVNSFLQNNLCDILIFLDSDAWIQNGYWLNHLINKLNNDNSIHGCFSRDPYVLKNTFINSGSFIIKNNDFIKQIYKNAIYELSNNTYYHNTWPYDQYYISKQIFENKDKFYIFIPDILNTPFGKIIRHNWLKNEKMYHDLYNLTLLNKEALISNNESINIEECFDREPFPNINEYGYEYF